MMSGGLSTNPVDVLPGEHGSLASVAVWNTDPDKNSSQFVTALNVNATLLLSCIALAALTPSNPNWSIKLLQSASSE